MITLLGELPSELKDPKRIKGIPLWKKKIKTNDSVFLVHILALSQLQNMKSLFKI